MDINKLAREIGSLDSNEINELSSALLEHNISATMYRFGGIQTDIKTSATVFLRKTGDRKLLLLKTIKEELGLGLREAKAVVDAAPCVVLENTSIERAESLKEALDECGATTEIITI